MNLRAVGWLLGCVLLLFAASMLAPALVSAWYGERAGFEGCILSAVVTAAARHPPTAAMLVFTKMIETELMSVMVPAASCEAPLNPNQPSHRISVPRAASGMFEPGIGFTPLPKYLPVRGPMIRAPVRAAQPPTE